jgi:hypothetical protein
LHALKSSSTPKRRTQLQKGTDARFQLGYPFLHARNTETLNSPFPTCWFSNTARWQAISQADHAILGLCIICDALYKSGISSQMVSTRTPTIEAIIVCWTFILQHEAVINRNVASDGGHSWLRVLLGLIVETAGSPRPVADFFAAAPTYPVIWSPLRIGKRPPVAHIGHLYGIHGVDLCYIISGLLSPWISPQRGRCARGSLEAASLFALQAVYAF